MIKIINETGIAMTDDSMALWLSVAYSEIGDTDCIENAWLSTMFRKYTQNIRNTDGISELNRG